MLPRTDTNHKPQWAALRYNYMGTGQIIGKGYGKAP